MIQDIDTMMKIGLFYNHDPIFNFHLVLSSYDYSKQNQQSLGELDIGL